MNPLMKHFFFSTLKRQTEKQVKKAGKNYGRLLSISFIADQEKIIQRVKFESYEGDSVLDAEDKKRLSSLLGINLEKEQDQCLNFFAILNFENKTIKAKKVFKDKRPDELIII